MVDFAGFFPKCFFFLCSPLVLILEISLLSQHLKVKHEASSVRHLSLRVSFALWRAPSPAATRACSDWNTFELDSPNLDWKWCLPKVHSRTWATCPQGVNSNWANFSNKSCGYVTGREMAQLNRAVRMTGGEGGHLQRNGWKCCFFAVMWWTEQCRVWGCCVQMFLFNPTSACLARTSHLLEGKEHKP